MSQHQQFQTHLNSQLKGQQNEFELLQSKEIQLNLRQDTSSQIQHPSPQHKNKRKLKRQINIDHDELQLENIQSNKKMTKRNKLIQKQNKYLQQIKPWLDEEPTIPFAFEDQISSISYRTEQITPQDSLFGFIRKTQFNSQQQSERLSQFSSYPPIPKYEYQVKSDFDQPEESSRMEEQSSRQFQSQSPFTAIEQNQNQVAQFQQSSANRQSQQQINQNKNREHINCQKRMKIASSECNIPNLSQCINKFFKKRQLIVVPQYQSKIQDDSLLAVEGVQFRCSVIQFKTQQPIQIYPDFLPQLHISQQLDRLRQIKLLKAPKNEHNQKLQGKKIHQKEHSSQSSNIANVNVNKQELGE